MMRALVLLAISIAVNAKVGRSIASDLIANTSLLAEREKTSNALRGDHCRMV